MHGGFRQIPPRIEDLASAVQFLNELAWNISWGEADGQWIVLTGDQTLYKAAGREDVEGFLMGLAVSAALIEKNSGVTLPRRGPLQSAHTTPLSREGRWEALWPETRPGPS